MLRGGGLGVRDLKAVVDANGVKKAILIGHSLGVQVILEFYRRYPERVAALIPTLGTYGHPMDTFYDSGLSRHLFKVTYAFGTNFPRLSNLVSRFLLANPFSFYLGGMLKIMHTGMINKEDIARYTEHILQVDPVFFTKLLKSAQDHSSEEMLHSIKVPTLIISAEHDMFTPQWISKKMHKLIRGSELFNIAHGTHAALVEQRELINLRIEKFLNERI